jgi:GNAT superfamily N-acetyltransferase
MKLESRDSILLETDRAKVVVRRAEPFEITRVRSFVEKNFSVAWADEISVGFTSKPVSVYLAVVEREIVGFAAYECTRRSFFGPTGVIENMQGRGIGKALLLSCLWGLRELGYIYAIIGRAGPVEFYEKTVGAIVIPDSDPGIYTNLLNER